jgi:hypothetical protein
MTNYERKADEATVTDSGREALRRATREVLANQLRDNDPPETRETYDRLLSRGIAEGEVRRLLSAIITVEIFEVVKEGRPFDRARFVERLRALPTLDFD